MVPLEAYFDESSTHRGSRIMCVAGYVFLPKSARSFDKAWRQVLQKNNLPFINASCRVKLSFQSRRLFCRRYYYAMQVLEVPFSFVISKDAISQHRISHFVRDLIGSLNCQSTSAGSFDLTTLMWPLKAYYKSE